MRQQGMNTAYHDRVAFHTAFCVVSTGKDAEGEFVFYVPCDTLAAAETEAKFQVREGGAPWAAVYQATESGVAVHLRTWESLEVEVESA